jgi:cell division transport system permease protein
MIKYGFQSFWRNSSLSIATIVVMVLALLLFNGLTMFDVLTKTATDSLRDKIDIAVYFKVAAPEDDILKIEKALEQLPEVKSVQYISRDKALEIFKENHKDDPTISQALQELSANPLRASVNIKANDTKDYPIIASYLENDNFKTIVEKITYAQNQKAIERLNKIIDTVNKVGLVLAIFIAIAACLVAFNTIRLAIYSNREEIAIMRLVGGSNTFIKGPYIVNGILYGVFGAILTMLIAAPAINFASPYFAAIIPEVNIEVYFYSNLLQLFGYLILAGCGLGIISSWIAIRRYLKV